MSFLSDILASTDARVREAKQYVTEEVLEQRIAAVEPARGFRRALTGPEMALIAEIKRATPSKGILRADLEARRTAHAYAEGGAAAVSVLTEPDHFMGSLDDLAAARDARLPTLRKDFLIDTFQVFEARAYGADAILVIVRIVDDEMLRDLVRGAEMLGMDALVEVASEEDLDRATAAGASLIGINHRDLETFDVDPERTAKLAPRVTEGTTVVALSGVATRAEVVALEDAGADAVLVGETLVRSPDPAATIRMLLGR